MITRDWILDTLGKLDLRYWPIFLWEIYWLDRYLTARRAEHRSGLNSPRAHLGYCSHPAMSLGSCAQ